MSTPRPPRQGYRYRKYPPQPQQSKTTKLDEEHMHPRLRFRIFGLHWRLQSLYRQAGCPFGETIVGMVLWMEFGRRSRSN